MIWVWIYVVSHFGFNTAVIVLDVGIILNALSYGLLYGYMGYLMTTLSEPQDPGKSQNVVKMLQSGSSFTIEDDLYQA